MTDAPTADFRVFRVDAGESTEPRVSVMGSGRWHSIVELVETAAEASAVVLVRPGAILHHGFGEEVMHAIDDPGLEGISWLGLASDGVDLDGHRHDTGNYLDDPADPAPRPLRIAMRAEPAVLVIDTRELDRAGAGPIASSYREFMERLIASDGPVILTSRLRFSAHDRLESSESTHADGATVDHGRSADRDLGWLRTVRRDPSIGVIIRTTCDRPALFERAVSAVDAELNRSVDAGHELIVVSERPVAEIEAHIAATTPVAMARIRAVSAPDTDLPGRTAAMLAGLEAAGTDYVWFVDDDDWIESGALDVVVSGVHAHDRPLIIGAVSSFEERTDGSLERIRSYLPEEWHRAFTGWNHLPNCALVFPRTVCRERAEAAGIRHDLGEDYALQLLVLTAPGMTVTTTRRTIANVSVRDGGTTVSMEDRTPWLADIGSHISDLTRDPAASASALWRLGRAVRSLPYPAPTDERPDPAVDEAGRAPEQVRRRFRMLRRRS